jgi:beta-galactosidase
LKVVAYKNEKKWAEAVVQTTGEPRKLSASADRSVIRADGSDLSFVTLRVVDASGRTAPRANSSIRFQLDGPGEIVATDNGDPSDFTPFPSHERRAFHGLCLVIVRSLAGKPGAIELKATADGLEAAIVQLGSVTASGK